MLGGNVHRRRCRRCPRSRSADSKDLRLLARVGVVDPTSLDAYRASGGYAALRRAFEMGAEAVIREVTDVETRWAAAARRSPRAANGKPWRSKPARPHYLICNADESEPGTFKDRVLMEGDPFAIIEAMTIAAFATGCERGYIYIRGEYPLATARLQHAIDTARAHGMLGDNIMGHGFALEIEIRRGGGAYICGEETAIFNSIEGYRGEPRNKPPFPAESGVFRKPTCVNNVETLANIPVHRARTAARHSRRSARRSPPARGSSASPAPSSGPACTKCRSAPRCATCSPSPAARAASGRSKPCCSAARPACSCAPTSSTSRSPSRARAQAKATLGSGVIMAFDDTTDLTQVILRIAAFFRDESCGQCVPCRVGTVRQEEALHRLASSARAAASRPNSRCSTRSARP